MGMINGQKYYISDSVPNADINVPTQGTPVDLFALTAANNVPVLFEYGQVNCSVNAAEIQKGALVFRSTPGTGGAGMGIRNASPAGPGASMTAVSLVTTPGAISGTPSWNEDWQQFGALEIDKRDSPITIVPGITLAWELPSVAATFACNINLEATEVK